MANFFSADYWKALYFKAMGGQETAVDPNAMSGTFAGVADFTGTLDASGSSAADMAGSFAGTSTFTGSTSRRPTIDLTFTGDKKPKNPNPIAKVIPWLWRIGYADGLGSPEADQNSDGKRRKPGARPKTKQPDDLAAKAAKAAKVADVAALAAANELKIAQDDEELTIILLMAA